MDQPTAYEQLYDYAHTQDLDIELHTDGALTNSGRRIASMRLTSRRTHETIATTTLTGIHDIERASSAMLKQLVQ